MALVEPSVSPSKPAASSCKGLNHYHDHHLLMIAQRQEVIESLSSGRNGPFESRELSRHLVRFGYGDSPYVSLRLKS